MNISYYWNGDRDGRRRFAISHTTEMDKNFSKEIKYSVDNTEIYDNNFLFTKAKNIDKVFVSLQAMGSAEAIANFAEGKTAVLNFASYKEPGGRFIDGSRAQEECLCAESFLYNVLRQFPHYYEWNKNRHLNNALYLNRALYSPDIIFVHNNKNVKCDVITCAAPNITPSRKYGWGITEEQNTQALDSRIEFVLKIAADQNVDTLILGAYGCGVFGQDAEEVCSLFMKHLKNYHCFKKVIFAIPQDIHGGNYDKFAKVLGGIENDT